MRLIDADVLLNEIKDDTEVVIEQDDKAGSFWLGYIAGLVIKQPTIQLDTPNINDWDSISRQEVIDALNEYFTRIGKLEKEGLTEGEKAISLDTVRIIKTLPAVQSEPHEGHWIDKGWNGDWAWQIDGRGNCWRVIECSECGKSVLVESNFCPHCGAEMRRKIND